MFWHELKGYVYAQLDNTTAGHVRNEGPLTMLWADGEWEINEQVKICNNYATQR